MYRCIQIAFGVCFFLTIQHVASAQSGRSDAALHYVANTRPPDAYLALRTHPSSTRGLRIAALPNGTALKILDRLPNGWWQVQVVPGGQQGWVLGFQGNKVWVECCLTAAVTTNVQTYEPIGFRSPSNNIHCQAFDGDSDETYLRCDVSQLANLPPPRPKDCDLDWGQAFSMDRTNEANRICYSDTVQDERLGMLRYGEVWRRKGFTCKSEQTGVTCINETGRGFELSRTFQRLF